MWVFLLGLAGLLLRVAEGDLLFVLTKSRQKTIQEKPMVSLENLFLFDFWLVLVLVVWFRLPAEGYSFIFPVAQILTDRPVHIQKPYRFVQGHQHQT